MTEKANPSINRPATAFHTAGAIGYGGHASGDKPGFVIDGANPTEIAQQDGIDETVFDTFQQTSSSASYTVEIAPGEGFVFGSWVATDSTTTINLDVSTPGQTVYLGWNKNGTNDVIIGKEGVFASASGDTDLKIPLWTFDTDGSGVSNVTDERRIGYTIGDTTVGGTFDVDGPTTLADLTVNGTPTFNTQIEAVAGIDANAPVNISDDLVLDDSDGQQYITVSGDGHTLNITQSGGSDFSTLYTNARNFNIASNVVTVESGGSLRSEAFEDLNGNVMASSVVASGQVTLSGGSGVVSTGISAGDATFNLAIGVDDPNSDVKVSGRLFWDDSANEYKVEVVETATSVGNPTVNYDVIRVR